MTNATIGVDIGGTKILAGIMTFDGEVRLTRTIPTPSHPESILDAVITICRDLIAHDEYTVQAIGIGTAGQVDPIGGMITYANSNLPGWIHTPIKKIIETALNLPVIVENDVNAMAIGEGQFGIGANYQHILYLSIGTGIGGAIVLHGKIWTGTHHSAGEIGYMVAGWQGEKPVTLEQRASGPGIAADYHVRSGKMERPTLLEIARRGEAGDELATRVIRDGANTLGHVLGPVINLLDPEIVIIGGGVPKIGPLWWQTFEKAVRHLPIPAIQNVIIASAKLSTHAGLIGAAWLAHQAVQSKAH